MSELWGYTAGQRMAERDFREQRLADLAIQKDEIAVSQSLAAMDMQKKVAAASGQLKQPTSADEFVADLYARANINMQAGNTVKAGEIAKLASGLNKSSLDAEKAQLEVTTKKMEIYSSLLSGVTDEGSWKRANATFQIRTGTPSLYSDKPYSPALVEELQKGILALKDQSAIAAAQARKKSSEAAATEATARIDLIKAQTDLTRRRDSQLQKAGAGNTIPKASSTRAITDLMTKTFGYAVMPEDGRVLARPIAEEMEKLMRTQSLSQSEAANQAFIAAKERGHFSGYKVRPAQLGTEARPRELPTVKGQVDSAKLEDNLWYNVNGVPRLWMSGAKSFYTSDELAELDDLGDE